MCILFDFTKQHAEFYTQVTVSFQDDFIGLFTQPFIPRGEKM